MQSISIDLPPPTAHRPLRQREGANVRASRGRGGKRCGVLTSAHGMAVAQLGRGAIASAHQLLKVEKVGSY